ncbi:MAG: class I SAM-dependent methyltransferase [Planctomycetota bacterium]|jgi:malonyl-CoA O-methyltransferase
MTSDPPPSPTTIDTRAGYDRWSQVYDGDGNPLVATEQPVLERMVGDPTGRTILDVGCGTGRHSIDLAKRGGRVTAVDFSRGMLDKALAKPGAGAVSFVQHDLRTTLPFEDRRFEIVVCALVLDHIHALTHFYAELKRVCRRDGRIVTTVMHPAMMLKGVQARFIDPETTDRVVLDSAPNMTSDYVNAVHAAGLSIELMEEHGVTEDIASKCPRAVPYLNWPILLAMVLTPTT